MGDKKIKLFPTQNRLKPNTSNSFKELIFVTTQRY